jgi:hypothetical protein
MAQLREQHLLVLLRALASGDVGQHHHGADHLLARVVERPGTEQVMPRVARASQPHLDAGQHLALEHFPELAHETMGGGLPVRGPGGRKRQGLRQRPPDQIGSAQRQCRLTGMRHRAGGITDDDRLRGLLQDRAQKALRGNDLLGPLLLGEIARDHGDHENIVIHGQRSKREQGRHLATVGPPQRL